MEKERPDSPPKLVDVVRNDFPQTSEVLVSFPDQWEYLGTIESAGPSVYITGFPIDRSRTSRDHFAGLSPEINVSLVFYRLYKFFQPWPMPQLAVQWNERKREGRVTGDRGFKLQLQPVGQAQAWFGIDHTLIWECYFDELQRRGDWQDRLSAVWKIIEKDVGTEHLWTAPHEPAFPEGYREFLTRLGYAPNVGHPLWWSKHNEQERLSIMPK